ncbi:hypothetical protein [Spiroplasma endosymbiont of Polydrusus formosus]|uniref:hypothetical protein n=1 Tax=Spiroplasma endosymbiont of Polydrusus formosus TaxID=3139326 RepID=UPI0035B57057
MVAWLLIKISHIGLELVLADTYKNLSLRIYTLLQNAKILDFSYFKEKLDIKEYRDDLYTDFV